MIEEEYIRLIFGLKLKQIRTDKDLSLFGLSKLTGMSKSYLNEIEKGKKYPKTDKISILATALDIPYDHMVSLKLDKNLAPLGEILQSRILKEIPLELFGIKESNLIDIISNAPAKVNAFISTMIKVGHNYNLTRENFFLAALRSYQEAHNNYFEDLEYKAEKFAKSYNINLNSKIHSDELKEILIEEYNYTINTQELKQHNELRNLRSVFIPKSKTLLLADYIDESQKAFIFAKEIAYNYLSIKDRLYTFSWIKFDSFDQVLNNAMASYFAGALLIPKNRLISELKSFFKTDHWSSDEFVKIMSDFTDSPETFFQRLTNVLPKFFNFKNLFFLRFANKIGTNSYQLNKELHITQQQAPHANESNQHYCRRWVSLRTLQELCKNPERSSVLDLQISDYTDSAYSYLVLSAATKDPFNLNFNRSVSIGILISPHLKKKVQFVNNEELTTKKVGVTCETCNIQHCKERAAQPTEILKSQKNKKIETIVQGLMDKFG